MDGKGMYVFNIIVEDCVGFGVYLFIYELVFINIVIIDINIKDFQVNQIYIFGVCCVNGLCLIGICLIDGQGLIIDVFNFIVSGIIGMVDFFRINVVNLVEEGLGNICVNSFGYDSVVIKLWIYKLLKILDSGVLYFYINGGFGFGLVWI